MPDPTASSTPIRSPDPTATAPPPTATPNRTAASTPDDRDKAYSAGLDALEAALKDLDEVRSMAMGRSQDVPDAVIDAFGEARRCDVPIDDLSSDPRDLLAAVVGIPNDPQLRAAREAPIRIAQDLATSHTESPTERDAITAYRAALDDINDSYLPVNNELNVARSDFVEGLIRAPQVSKCAQRLLFLSERVMDAFYQHYDAVSEYLSGIRRAIEKYKAAIRRARESLR